MVDLGDLGLGLKPQAQPGLDVPVADHVRGRDDKEAEALSRKLWESPARFNETIWPDPSGIS
jgi:hypothetical protein